MIKRANSFLTGLLLVAVASSAWSAPDRYVSPDGGNQWPFTNWDMATPDLCMAVNTANSNNAGDVVWIATGVYAPAAKIVVSNTIVRGITSNAEDIVITGNGNHECFILDHPHATLDSVTLSNGYYESVYRGGALTIFSGTVVNSIIGWSYAAYGGGISMQGSSLESALVDRCRIISNSCLQTGGGVSFVLGGGTIRDSTIAGNWTTSGSIPDGGGIGTYLATNVAILNCLIQDNTANRSGGGIYFNVAGTGRIWHCVVETNWSTGNGGGLYVVNASHGTANPDARNCIFRHNKAIKNGGGVSIAASSVSLYSCLIASNTAYSSTSQGGGGIFLRYNPEIENCTVVGNDAYRGGGIFQTLEKTAVFRNCVVYDNIKTSTTPSHATESDIGGATDSTQFFHCCASCDLGPGQNNITNPPHWVAGGNYRLQSGSPCINTGTNGEWMAGALDLDGRARLDRFSGKVDMGAYEYTPQGFLLWIR